MAQSAILNDILSAAGVRHTSAFTQEQFDAMPFRTLFGMGKLLQSYGISTQGIHIADKSQLMSLPMPLIAVTSAGPVVVRRVDGDTVTYVREGVGRTVSRGDFADGWTGDVMLVATDRCTAEPDYALHRVVEMADAAKRIMLPLLTVALGVYLLIAGRLLTMWSTVGIVVIDMLGLWMSYMLMQKTLNVHTVTADRVCGVIQSGGCDDVLKTRASSFFGIFSWSEVGLTYFGVSLMALLLFPSCIGALALCNVCCLPFTLWSIWYQRFRVHAWCTMCVTVQASLWLLFVCYCGGGWLAGAFGSMGSIVLLVGVYALVLLSVNRLKNFYLSHTARCNK